MLKDRDYANSLQVAEKLKENIQKQFQTFPEKNVKKYFKMREVKLFCK
jgi:hypothetical protein